MTGLIRAASICGMLALGLVSAQAAEKAFKRDDLADSAIKLEAQIEGEAGPVNKSAATLRTDADVAFKRYDFRAGSQILGQIAAIAPEDSGNWLRLSRVIFQIFPKSASEQTFLLERASTERYNINLLAGLPSTVKETLPKSAEFNIYVRDRKPFVRFTGRAYVLPRTGQRGIPLVSVNTSSVTIDVYRIGDRNLINTVINSDFQRPINRHRFSDLGNERGAKVWSGEFAHIMVSDDLPAGLEIDNPHLVSSGDSGTLDWIEDGEEPVNTEFRDDRFTAAIDRATDSKSVFTVAYVVRAVSPGKYVLPQAYVEDMYNPSRYGHTGTGTAGVRGAK
jgi:uncharacterized protein YfaS (alpha-2-macroglobulin family)